MTTVTWGALADDKGSKMIADASRATLLAATNGNPLSAAIEMSKLKATQQTQVSQTDMNLALNIPKKPPEPSRGGPGGFGF